MADALSTAVTTEPKKVSDVVKWEADPLFSRVEGGLIADQGLDIGDIVELSGTDYTRLVTTSPDGIFIQKLETLLIRATADLTFAANPTADDTVVIGGRTYTFVAAPSSGDDIDIGSDAAESADNLMAAINGGVGAGSAYIEGSPVENAHVTAKPRVGDVLRVVAKTPGAAGNAVALSSAGATEPTWSAATLLGGRGTDPPKGVILVRDSVVDGTQLNYNGQTVATVNTALLALGIVVKG